jgi:thiamine pyrophosphate-dependent acetolactate synthase large subunit-like protein
LQQEPALLPAYRRRDTVAVKPDAGLVNDVAKRLMSARAPVLAAGKGIMRQGAMCWPLRGRNPRWWK